MKPTTALWGSLGTAAALGNLMGKEERNTPTLAEGFTWNYPFSGTDSGHGPPEGFTATCSVEATFPARQHNLRDHMTEPPQGFLPWAEGLKPQFGGRAFPGGWEGVDAHGTLRLILIMEYADVPGPVKDWIEGPEGQKSGLFGVYDKPKNETENEAKEAINETAGPRESDDDKGERQVMIFAPGALYHILPLWVAQGSGCEAQLLDLEKYNAAIEDNGVAAWPIHRTMPDRRRDRREIEFTIKAQVLKKIPGWTAPNSSEEPKAAPSAKPDLEEPASQASQAVDDATAAGKDKEAKLDLEADMSGKDEGNKDEL